MIKKLMIPIFSILCVFLYYSPWIIDNYYIGNYFRTVPFIITFIISMMWAAIAWIFVIVFIVLFIIDVIRRKSFNIYRMVSVISIVIFYVAWFWAIAHGVVVTA